MSGNQDFVIGNVVWDTGVLKKYTGPGGDVTIPEGVAKIGEDAFRCCKSLTSVTIPAGITVIGSETFAGCTSLRSVTIPESVTEIDETVFTGCEKLTELLVGKGNSVYRDIDGILFKGDVLICCPEGKEGDVTIPKDVTRIEDRAFCKCKKLTSVTIPEGVTSIGEYAFSGCNRLDQVDLPRSIREIRVVSYQLMAEKVYKLMPEGVLQTVNKLNPELTALIDKVWCEQLTPKDWAGLYLFQTAKEFQELCKKHMKNVPADECLSAMLELLADCKKSSAYVQAANYVVEHPKEVSPESIRALYEIAAAKKSFQKAADILKPLVSSKKKKAAGPDGPFAFLEEQLLKHYKEQKGVLARLGKVLLADGSGQKTPKLAVLAAVMPYADLYIKPTRTNGYKKTELQFLSESDKAAALLDHEGLMGLLWANAKTLNSLSWLLPYCRLANGKEIQSLLSERKAWGRLVPLL